MIIDIAVGVVVLLSAVVSFLRGFIREILTIVGVVGGIAASYYFSPHVAPYFQSWLGVSEEGAPDKLFDIVPMSVVADIASYGSIFILVVMAITVVSHFTSGAVKAVGLGPIDRTLGVIFGIARAVILLGLLYLPFHLLMDQDAKDGFFAESKTHFYIEKTAGFMAGFLPSSERVEKEAENAVKKKLQEQDILRRDDEGTDDDQKNSKDGGYGQKERDEINRLFQQRDYNE